MAQYKIKKGHELDSTWIGRKKYVLAECSQGDLSMLYSLGNASIEVIQPKKESKKVKEEESPKDGE